MGRRGPQTRKLSDEELLRVLTLAQWGLSVEDICDQLVVPGLSASTLHRLMDRTPEVRRLFAEAKRLRRLENVGLASMADGSLPCTDADVFKQLYGMANGVVVPVYQRAEDGTLYCKRLYVPGSPRAAFLFSAITNPAGILSYLAERPNAAADIPEAGREVLEELAKPCTNEDHARAFASKLIGIAAHGRARKVIEKEKASVEVAEKQKRRRKPVSV